MFKKKGWDKEVLHIKVFTNSGIVFSLLSGLIFLAVFEIGLHQVPNNYYENRDDGIITLSHAKNLADFGSISVNPSGERVEGFSSPAQFVLYYFIYKISGISYQTYNKYQPIIFAFLLGFLFMRFFKTKYILGIIFSIFSAVILVLDTSFLEWHGSGMENAISHFLFLLAIFLLYKMFAERKIYYPFAFFIFCASISRIESMYYVGPILFIFSIFWLKNIKNYKGACFSLLVFVLWVIFSLFRYIYFNDFLPNTAFAQGISILERLRSHILFSPGIYSHSFEQFKLIFIGHHGFLVLLSLLGFAFTKKSKEWIFLFMILISFIFLTCINPVFFGESILDRTRTSSHMAVLAVTLISMTIFQLKRKKQLLLGIMILLPLSLVGAKNFAVKPYYLPWDTDYYLSIREELLILQKKHDLFRPTVCNADLGAISWHKDFNIVDLGRLGNPILSRLKGQKSIANYLYDFSCPDFIELHDSWSCLHSYLFEDERFTKMYEPFREQRTEWLNENCKQSEMAKTGIWIRKEIKIDSNSRERQLIDKLRDDLSISIIKNEIETRPEKQNILSSLYIVRSVYRFLPELIEKGYLDELKLLFQDTKTSLYDLAILQCRSNSRWHKNALSFLNEYNHRGMNRQFQETGMLKIKDIILKEGFHDDEIFTKGKATLYNIDYQFKPTDKYFVIHTYGFRPEFLRAYETVRVIVRLNSTEIPYSHTDGLSYFFTVPKEMRPINSIKIFSSTFVPKKHKINPDTRKLGIDIKSIEIKSE